MKIKKGDIVKIIAGRYKGAVAKVIRSIPKKQHVIIEGINIKKKSVKKSKSSNNDNYMYFEYPIHVSNVMLAKKGDSELIAADPDISSAKSSINDQK